MNFDLDDFYFERTKRLNLPDETFNDYVDRMRMSNRERYGNSQMRTAVFLTIFEVKTHSKNSPDRYRSSGHIHTPESPSSLEIYRRTTILGQYTKRESIYALLK